MTNVPENIRAAWKEVYVLFDTHYMMDNTEDAWNEFWKQAKGIMAKHQDMKRIMDMLVTVSDMISDRMINGG